MLHARALIAVLDGDIRGEDSRKSSFAQVVESLVTHEKRRWLVTAAAWDWGTGVAPSKGVQEKAVATLLLLGSASELEARQTLRRVPELRDATEERLSAIAAWVIEQYAPDSYGIFHLCPDLVGEWFVTLKLVDDPELAQDLRDDLTDVQAARALGFLARAADDVDTADGLFASFASGDVRRRVLAAGQAAMTAEVGRHLLDPVMASAIRSADGWSLDQLAALDRDIPSRVLLRTHVAIADRIVGILRGLAASDPVAYQRDLAVSLNILGARLDRVGSYTDALGATEEAVGIERDLAASDLAADQEDLADALNNLGVRLERLGQHQEALAATEDAVRIRRGLAASDTATHQGGAAAFPRPLSGVPFRGGGRCPHPPQPGRQRYGHPPGRPRGLAR